MSNSPYQNPMAGMGNMLGQGTYGGSTVTTTAAGTGIGIGYPGQIVSGHNHVVYPTTYPQYEPPMQPDECGRIVLRKIDNGFIVMFQKAIGALALQYYAEDMKAVGERITACMVANALESTK